MHLKEQCGRCLTSPCVADHRDPGCVAVTADWSPQQAAGSEPPAHQCSSACWRGSGQSRIIFYLFIFLYFS